MEIGFQRNFLNFSYDLALVILNKSPNGQINIFAARGLQRRVDRHMTHEKIR